MGRPNLTQSSSIRKSRSTPSITEGLGSGEAGRPGRGAMQEGGDANHRHMLA